MAEGMQFTSDLGEAMLGRGPAQRLAIAKRFCSMSELIRFAPIRQLCCRRQKAGIEAPASLSSDDRDGWLDLLLVERVQPHLGQERPVCCTIFPPARRH